MDNRIDAQEKAKADIFEAILGAIAISCQWDPEILQNVVKKKISIEAYLTELESDRCRTEDLSADNAVNTLKEMEEHGMCSFLIYEFNLPEELGGD
ncbi:ribonuclease III domain-containing protein [Emergencia sp. 1XD21-10]|uniref:ribonuclease III domain-containing protein n=1 Tax=Emergencia sp. 1XD21-10 TaxID=2304569 RepID=UPI00137ADD27|nr:ribonuclease III domain-containing protein [Emergencia sp. 1XD21-10]NCE99542.1 hypothetical protein [Emergencia sp. 1XD21-10]